MNNTQQQNPYEFMKFIKVDGEKYVGIAVIRYERRFIFRFKIMPNDQGGYWAFTASMKTGVLNGKDKYEPSFSLDSDYEKSQLTDFVLQNVERELAQVSNNPTSIFSAQPIQQQHAQAHTQYQSQQARPYVAPQPQMNFQQQPQQQAQQKQAIENEYIPF